MRKFRTLAIAKELYQEAKKQKLGSVMQNQFDRALLSILLSLQEGAAKPTAKDRKKFYYIALGSYREVCLILELAEKNELLGKFDVLGAHLYKLCRNT